MPELNSPFLDGENVLSASEADRTLPSSSVLETPFLQELALATDEAFAPTDEAFAPTDEAFAPTDEAESSAGEVQFEELEPLQDEQTRDLESDAVPEFAAEEGEAEDNYKIDQTHEEWSPTGDNSHEAIREREEVEQELYQTEEVDRTEQDADRTGLEANETEQDADRTGLEVTETEQEVEHEKGYRSPLKATDKQREQMQPYLPENGQGYSEEERRYAVTDPRGLIRTATVIGKNEKLLSKQGSAQIRLGRELSSFEGGKLGKFADTYNEFVIYMNELLAGLGRVQDLEKVGAPVLPSEMNNLQKKAMRRTDDTKPQEPRKQAFRAWRDSRADYGRAVSETVDASKGLSEARRDYWVANTELEKFLLERKRLAKTGAELKSLKDFDLSLKDLKDLATGGKWGPAKKAKEYRERRKEWEKKVADFNQSAAQAKLTNFTVVTNLQSAAAKVYSAQEKRDMLFGIGESEDNGGPAKLLSLPRARLLTRDAAAGFGQISSSAPPARMPPLMADAYFAIAAVGPEATQELRRAHRYNPTLINALRRYQPERLAADESRKNPNHPFFRHDITQVRDATVYLQKWQPQVLDLIVEDALTIHKHWDAFFKDLYR